MMNLVNKKTNKEILKIVKELINLLISLINNEHRKSISS